MIQKYKIKLIIKKEYGKKIGEKALNKLDKSASEYIKEVIKKASRKSDFSGRIIIQEQDIG